MRRLARGRSALSPGVAVAAPVSFQSDRQDAPATSATTQAPSSMGRPMVIDRRDMAISAGPFDASDDMRPLSAIDLVLIHRNTAGGSLDEVRRFHAENGTEQLRLFPYHFFLDYDSDDKDGSNGYGNILVQQVHALDIKSPHAGGENRRAVGIAINVDGRRYAPSGEMLVALSILCARIHAAFPRASIRGHSQLKQCPGKLVPVQWIAARSAMMAQTMGSTPLADAGIRRNHE